MGVITASTALYGVLGRPARHSVSPVIHNGWIGDHGFDALYVAFDGQSGDAAAILQGLWGAGVAGLNVTLPYKSDALAAAASATPRAVSAGAANVLWRGEGGWSADTTDAAGFLADLDARAPGWMDVPGPWVIIGAGGVGRSLLDALVQRARLIGRIDEFRLINRSIERAIEAAHSSDHVQVFAFTALTEALTGAALVVNCTSRGLKGNDPLAPDFAATHPDATVYDTVYVPRRTAFLEAASHRRALDGLGMLVGQAALSFEIWFGTQPSLDDGLRRAVAALEAAP
jgi:shikimate dehydrogenase